MYRNQPVKLVQIISLFRFIINKYKWKCIQIIYNDCQIRIRFEIRLIFFQLRLLKNGNLLDGKLLRMCVTITILKTKSDLIDNH